MWQFYIKNIISMSEQEDIINTESCGGIEDIQEKVQNKLANILSFYNEQEFLDQLHEDTVK
jgi:hypothetical protein